MKRQIFLKTFIILMFCMQIFAGSDLKLLKIKEPTGPLKGKNILFLNFDNIKEITKNFDYQAVTGRIDFVYIENNIYIKLGKIKKGKLKWLHKISDEGWLKVKFKADFLVILTKMKEKPMNPGFQIQISGFKATKDSKKKESKSVTILFSSNITCKEYVDLAVKLKYPQKVLPGKEMKEDIFVTIENKGIAPASDFNIDLMFSGKTLNMAKKPVYSESFTENAVLRLGTRKIPLLKPGEKQTFNFNNSIKISEDVSAVGYHIGVLCDPENRVEEIDEKNNSDLGMIMISIPEVKSFSWEIPNAQLIYEPYAYNLKVTIDGNLISQGNDWRKCKIRPYIFQIKHISWGDKKHWEVNTNERSFWQVTGRPYCKSGGQAKELRTRVKVKGGSKTVVPSKITINLPKILLKYECTTGKFKVLAYKNQIAYLPLWKVSRLKTHIFHLQCALWNNFFWEVNTMKKQVIRITGGKFGSSGGTRNTLEVNLLVE